MHAWNGEEQNSEKRYDALYTLSLVWNKLKKFVILYCNSDENKNNK